MRLTEERLDRRMQRINILGKSVSVFHRSRMTPREFFPTLGVIADLPHISEILNYGDEGAFKELKGGIMQQLPGITDQIRRDREKTLLKLLPPGYTSTEPLKLATTWFSNGIFSKAARVEDVINEMWGSIRREAWDRVSINGGIRWSSVVPKIGFEKKVMAVVTQLITDLRVGDPKEMTAEELDNESCRIVMFSKDPKKPVLKMEVGSWRHLVRNVSFHTLGAPRVSLLRVRYKRSPMRDCEPPTGGSLMTTNSQTSRPSVKIPSTSCGIACVVGGRETITALKIPTRHRNIYWMREF